MAVIHNRRWLSFSLRTALIATTAVAIWLSLLVSSARQQRIATLAIQDLGGSVTYDYQAATGKFVADAIPYGPHWLRTIAGRDWFDTVHGVGLYSCQGASDKAIASALRGVPQTHSLQLDGSNAGIGNDGKHSSHEIVTQSYVEQNSRRRRETPLSFRIAKLAEPRHSADECLPRGSTTTPDCAAELPYRI